MSLTQRDVDELTHFVVSAHEARVDEVNASLFGDTRDLAPSEAFLGIGKSKITIKTERTTKTRSGLKKKVAVAKDLTVTMRLKIGNTSLGAVLDKWKAMLGTGDPSTITRQRGQISISKDRTGESLKSLGIRDGDTLVMTLPEEAAVKLNITETNVELQPNLN